MKKVTKPVSNRASPQSDFPNPLRSSRGAELKGKLRFMKQSMDAMSLLVEDYLEGNSEDDNSRELGGKKSIDNGWMTSNKGQVRPF
jgi:hypothetical protein